jgi:prepilin-type N-terminal cleavage/methylation domain-containing protein
MISRNNNTVRRGFTMVELLVSVVILGLITSVTYGIFSAVTKAWQRGMALSDEMQHGDFVMEQLVMGLRSSYYRDAGKGLDVRFGFWLEDQGNGPSANDTISWVKIGPSLIGRGTEQSKGPHRVKFQLVDDPNTDESAAAITVWSPDEYLQPDDFDPDMLEPTLLATGIVGFDCRVSTNVDESEIIWEGEWEETNSIPRLVELTLYLKPLQSGEEPVAMKRCVEIPVGKQFWPNQ